MWGDGRGGAFPQYDNRNELHVSHQRVKRKVGWHASLDTVSVGESARGFAPCICCRRLPQFRITREGATPKELGNLTKFQGENLSSNDLDREPTTLSLAVGVFAKAMVACG